MNTNFDNIAKTYSGKANSCRCGCKGKYAEGGSRVTYNRVMHQHTMFPGNVSDTPFCNEVLRRRPSRRP
jgi:hypothetical protein